MGLHEFTQELPAYREKVRTSGHDARRQSFFDLARKAFDIDMLAWEETAWEVEAKVYRGWVDALLGVPEAITATAHKLARLIYSMLRYGHEYVDAGQDYYERQYRERVLYNMARTAKTLGYKLV